MPAHAHVEYGRHPANQFRPLFERAGKSHLHELSVSLCALSSVGMNDGYRFCVALMPRLNCECRANPHLMPKTPWVGNTRRRLAEVSGRYGVVPLTSGWKHHSRGRRLHSSAFGHQTWSRRCPRPVVSARTCFFRCRVLGLGLSPYAGALSVRSQTPRRIPRAAFTRGSGVPRRFETQEVRGERTPAIPPGR